MKHAIEEYVGQIQELKSSVESQRKEIEVLVSENISLQTKVYELESKVFGGCTK